MTWGKTRAPVLVPADAGARTSVGRRLPAHPKVDPVEKTRPANVYPVGEEEIKLFPKYEKIWKEIFGLRKEPLHG